MEVRVTDMNDTMVKPPSGLYHFVWRWHFYAGLIVSPFLIMLAVTGGLYLFEREIDGFLHADAVQVEPGKEALPVSVQESAVRAAFPDALIGRYAAPWAPDRAAEWGITNTAGESLAVFVDPTTASITGTVPNSVRLTSILSTMHGELMIGRTGDLIVELAASWGFILLVTGLFLWWPRRSRAAGVALPRVTAKGRGFRRDLHAVPAMWIAPVLAFLILTGLPWSGFWGDNLAKLGTVQPLAPIMAATPNFTEFPNAPPHHAPPNAAGLDANPFAEELPWAIRHAEIPVIVEHASSDHDLHASAPTEYSIDRLTALTAARSMEGPGLRVFYPRDATGVLTASFVPDQAQRQRTLHVDPQTGDVLFDIGWNDYSPLGKAVEFGVMVHLGRQFGLANQLILAFVCGGFVAIIAAAIWMWWRRRPRGRIGAPPVPSGFRAGVTVIAIAVALGALFPLAGLSMLVIAFIDLAAKRVISIGVRS